MAAFDHRGLPFRARRCDVTAECRRELLESPDPRNDCSSIVLTESTPGAASQSVLQDLSAGSASTAVRLVLHSAIAVPAEIEEFPGISAL